MQSNSTKRWLWFAIRTVVVCVILSVIARKLDFTTMLAAIRDVSPAPVALAVCLFVLNRFITAAKWDLLLRRHGIRAGLLKLTRIMFESSFLGMAIPSGLGVDIARLVQIRMEKHSLTSSTSSVLADRVLAVLTLALMSVIAACFCGSRVGNRTVMALVICLGLATALAIVLLMSDLSLRVYSFFHRTVCLALDRIGLHSPAPGAGTAGKVMQKVTQVHESLAGLLRDRSAMAVVLGINVVVQLVRIAQVHLLFRAVGQPVPIILEIAFVPMILLIKLFPISPYMGIGVQEGAFVYFFNQVGISPEVSMSVSILMHLVVIMGIMPGALMFFLGKKK